MEYRLAESVIARLTKTVRWLRFLVVGLIVCNGLLSGLLVNQVRHHTVVLVPMGLTQSATVAANRVSASYLEAVAIMLINDRLNVTPDTLAGNDQHLLTFVDPAYYAAFKQQLASDEENVQQAKVASTFYLTQIQSHPSTLTVLVSGHLKRWVGERFIGEHDKHYRLTFVLRGYALSLTAFEEYADNTSAFSGSARQSFTGGHS